MNDKPTLRWGLLAAGRIAGAFAGGVKESRTGVLAAIGSRSLKKAKAFAEANGVPRAHGSYEELLADPEVDAIYIATPHPQHALWAIRAARAGKHVLCEKPIGMNAAEAMAVFEAAEVGGVYCMEAFMYRCSPLMSRLVELLREKAIGEVQAIDATFTFGSQFDAQSRIFANTLGGGGILDVGCYTASFARLVAGAARGKPFAEPTQVSGQAVLGETGVDEWAMALLKFDGGLLATLRCGVRLDSPNRAVIFGTEGRIELEMPWVPMRHGGSYDIRLTRGEGTEIVTVEADRDLYAYEADAFAEGVATGTAPHPAMSPADSIGNMRALDRWRGACGLTYEAETAAAFPTVTVAGELLAKRADAAMKYGRVAGVEKEISRLVMGCDNQEALPHAAILFDDFFERGGNAFDTAHIYGGGRMERLLGQWMTLRGVRDECVVVAKGVHTPYNLPEVVGIELQQTLERLQTDHVEIYLCHRDNEAVPVGEWCDALNEQVDAGRASVLGGSNWSLERVRAFNDYARANSRRPMGGVSNNLSLAELVEPMWPGCRTLHDQRWGEWRGFLVREKIAHLAWSSQARGFFVRDRDLSEPELVQCWTSENNLKRRRRAFELAEKKGASPINIAAAWVLAQPFESFALIGPRTLAETRTSLGVFDVSLTPAELEWLDLKSDSTA